MFIGIVIGAVAFVIGIFGFSQIFICLFFAIPTSYRLIKDGAFVSDMPVLKKYMPTIFIWIIILFIMAVLSFNYLNQYTMYILAGYLISSVIALLNNGANKNNIAEFIEQNSQYIKDND